ncbi:MAG: hypothetical protein LBR54_03495 [Oscillospiraceae bacterium]|jgi:tetratricopeptide (TPR) repeat protein|nr:hypothetical protein [Oscillospiraceae bacterium]
MNDSYYTPEGEKSYSEFSGQEYAGGNGNEEYIKLYIPVKIKIFLAVLAALFAFSVITFPSVLSNFRNYRQADEHLKAKEYSLAYDKYITVLEKYRGSPDFILKTADAAMGAQLFWEAYDAINTHLSGRDLSESEYSRAMEILDFTDKYLTTYEKIDEIFTELGETSSADDPVKNNNEILGKLEPLLKDDDMDKSYIYFIMGLLSSQTSEKSINYFDLATQQDKYSTYPYSYRATALRRMGKIDEAKELYEYALTKNACDALSMRGFAIVLMLDGKNEEALKTARYAYELDPYGEYVADTLIVVLCENGLRNEAEELLERITDEGFEMEESLKEFLDSNGAISIRDYYIGE